MTQELEIAREAMIEELFLWIHRCRRTVQWQHVLTWMKKNVASSVSVPLGLLPYFQKAPSSSVLPVMLGEVEGL
jgi:hypothetical protein